MPVFALVGAGVHLAVAGAEVDAGRLGVVTHIASRRTVP